jgi:hypothetical protein
MHYGNLINGGMQLFYMFLREDENKNQTIKTEHFK